MAQNEYTESLRDYVNEKLMEALQAGYDRSTFNYFEVQREALTLYDKIVHNPEFKEELLSRIVAHIEQYSAIYFKPELGDKALSHYMERVQKAQGHYEILNLARHYAKELEQEKAKRAGR